MNPQTTHFGFQQVPVQEKTARVRGVFDAAAPRYDVMNDLMSLGLHRFWKEALVDALKPRRGMRLLDLAGGTGDIAFRVKRREEQVEVTLADINAAMLLEGRDRAIDRNALNIAWTCANAESLPFADQSFDACTIAFGIRNVTHIMEALKEIYRSLKTGGHFLCLEFSSVPAPWLQGIYDWYSFRVIPPLGKRILGQDAPYRYLVQSIRRFPPPGRFTAMLRRAGFTRTQARPMSGGIVTLYSGWRV